MDEILLCSSFKTFFLFQKVIVMTKKKTLQFYMQ